MAKQAATETEEKKSTKTDSKRILIVDDDHEIVDSIRYALEARGHEILVARDGNQGLAMAEREDPDLVILDEAQRIKNQGTKTARVVKRLNSPWAFILTGTPLENRLAELHSLVEFLHRRALGPRWRLGPFHIVEDAQGRVLAYEGLEVLRRRLRGFFLRRDRREVLDQLPDRTDNTFWTGMTAQQRRPYRRQAARVARSTRHPAAWAQSCAVAQLASSVSQSV